VLDEAAFIDLLRIVRQRDGHAKKAGLQAAPFNAETRRRQSVFSIFASSSNPHICLQLLGIS